MDGLPQVLDQAVQLIIRGGSGLDKFERNRLVTAALYQLLTWRYYNATDQLSQAVRKAASSPTVCLHCVSGNGRWMSDRCHEISGVL